MRGVKYKLEIMHKSAINLANRDLISSVVTALTLKAIPANIREINKGITMLGFLKGVKNGFELR